LQSERPVEPNHLYVFFRHRHNPHCPVPDITTAFFMMAPRDSPLDGSGAADPLGPCRLTWGPTILDDRDKGVKERYGSAAKIRVAVALQEASGVEEIDVRHCGSALGAADVAKQSDVGVRELLEECERVELGAE
jgi:hypothetical protein